MLYNKSQRPIFSQRRVCNSANRTPFLSASFSVCWEVWSARVTCAQVYRSSISRRTYFQSRLLHWGAALGKFCFYTRYVMYEPLNYIQAWFNSKKSLRLNRTKIMNRKESQSVCPCCWCNGCRLSRNPLIRCMLHLHIHYANLSSLL